MKKNVYLGFLAKKGFIFFGSIWFYETKQKKCMVRSCSKNNVVDSLSIKATNHPRVPMTFSAAEWYTF